MSLGVHDHQRGETVRILDCPLNQQHRGLTGELIEANGRVVCVELSDGARCWTGNVESLNAKSPGPDLAEAKPEPGL